MAPLEDVRTHWSVALKEWWTVIVALAAVALVRAGILPHVGW
jgi:hypothetical protein